MTNQKPPYQQWYSQSEKDLVELCKDIDFRTNLQKRLEELKAVNYHGVRCAMSKDHELTLERVLILSGNV